MQARRKLVKILQVVMDKRRAREKSNITEEKTDMVDLLMEAEDENGRKMDDEEIIDVMLMYLNAGHESSAHATMWAALLLHNHPEYFQKAKVFFFKIYGNYDYVQIQSLVHMLSNYFFSVCYFPTQAVITNCSMHSFNNLYKHDYMHSFNNLY